MTDEFVFDDGRKAERVEVDQGKTKVIEIYVEPKPEKKLAKRITEKYCICEREIETIDELTGEIVSKVVEKVSDGETVSSFDKSTEALSMEKLIESKINKSKSSVAGMILFAVIAIQLVGLVYLLFAM